MLIEAGNKDFHGMELGAGMEGGGVMLSIAGSAHEGIFLEALIEMCEYGRSAGVYR